MPGTSRYNGNHNNLLVSFGAVNKQERQIIKNTQLQHYGRPYLCLTAAKMHAPKYIGYETILQIAPQKFQHHHLYLRSLEKLSKIEFIQLNPDNPEQYRISPLGIKYLYLKSQINQK